MVETGLILRVAQRHDADVQDARALVSPVEGLDKVVPVVCIGNKDDLRVNLNARFKKTVERIDAMIGIAADQLPAHLAIRYLKRNVKRGDALLDNTLLVFR